MAVPNAEEYFSYILTGSVATAGNQTFSLNSDDVGTLLPNETYFIRIEPSGGSGTVTFARSDSYAFDIKVDDGWDFLFRALGRVGVTPRVQLNGYLGATPVLLRAWFSSQPNEGDSYAAGENIEVKLVFSGSVDLADASYGLPLRLGSTGDYVEASPVQDAGYRWLFSYTVQPEDVSSDNVRIADLFLFLADDVTPGFVSESDNSVPIRTTLSAAIVEAEADHSVDGTQSWDCDHLYCGYLTVGGHPDGEDIGFGIDGGFSKGTKGMLTQQTLIYDANRYGIYRIELATYFFPLGSVRIMWLPDLPDAVLARLSFEAEGTEFRFSEADEKVDFYSSSYETNVQFYRWYDSGLDWEPGERVLVKIIEVAEVSFAADSHSADESGDVDITVSLSNMLDRDVIIPLTATNQGGAGEDDYSGVPANLTFVSGETEKSFTISLTDDDVDDDDESVLLAFGSLPPGLHEGDTASSTVTIVDNDDPQVEVNFRRAIHDVAEGADQTVTVKLTADPERTVVVPLTATNQDGATSADYAALPASVTFDPGDTSKTFTFTATDDAIDDDGERVVLGFGTLPDGVTPGTVPTSTVSIIDDDAPASVAVSWAQTTYSVAEGDSVTVTAELDDDPEKTVVVPIARTDQGGAGSADYSGVPSTITFESGDTSKSFTFTATDDALDDDDESVLLAFGPTLPSGVTQGTPAGTVVRITDDDDPEVKVSFGADRYAAAEGGSVTVTVNLDADPERTVVIPVTHTARAGATSADYSGVPANVTFDAGETAKEITFTATQDDIDDDGETVLLGFGTLPSDVSAGTSS